jgi:NADH:ubiquinone oxidoreductase subunit
LKGAAAAGKRRRIMGINLNPFTWWNGASWGTMLYGLRGMTQVGTDSLGNVYYQGGKDGSGRARRWVIYEGANDASRVPPEWFSWLHHHIDDVPDRALPAPRPWQKPPVPNMTGTPLAYRPSGALEKGGKRAAATGDYEAWTPEG